MKRKLSTTMEINCKVKLSLWSAIKMRIAGFKDVPKKEFPKYEDVWNQLIMNSDGRMFITAINYGEAMYVLLKDWYEYEEK